MAKVLLFDLDGTLLPMDTHEFIQYYIQQLTPKIAPVIEPDSFVPALLGGTKAMLTNVDPKLTNEQVFEQTFLQMTGLEKEDIWPMLDDFYDSVFPSFAHMTQPTATAKLVLEEAVNQGYRVAIATNPVFPKTAIYHRLAWAGIDHIAFDLVTVYEESRFTKPHKQYYEEICERLNVEPSECIMIGNDVQEDMVTSTLGMKTFLLEGNVIDRGNPTYTINDRGTIEQLLTKLQKKEGLFTK